MSRTDTAIRLAGKLLQLTVAGKLTWADAGTIGLPGERPCQVFKVQMADGMFARIAEVPVPRSLIVSYYFGIADGERDFGEPIYLGQDGILEAFAGAHEIFGIFAEGYPADPTDEKLKLLSTLKDLYIAAKDNAKGTWQKVEKFEQLLERLA
jgi:hypothetical protein